MIPLTRLVTSLEISKRLKELGIKQESQFYWARWFNNGFPITEVWSRAYAIDGPGGYNGDKASAFTTGELSIGMPKYSFTLWWEENSWRCSCDGEMLRYRQGLPKGRGYNEELRNYYDKNAADALGRLKIDLLENKLITIESVNAEIERGS